MCEVFGPQKMQNIWKSPFYNKVLGSYLLSRGGLWQHHSYPIKALHGGLVPNVMLDQWQALADTTELYLVPQLWPELSTLGSASSNTAFCHSAILFQWIISIVSESIHYQTSKFGQVHDMRWIFCVETWNARICRLFLSWIMLFLFLVKVITFQFSSVVANIIDLTNSKVGSS